MKKLILTFALVVAHIFVFGQARAYYTLNNLEKAFEGDQFIVQRDSVEMEFAGEMVMCPKVTINSESSLIKSEYFFMPYFGEYRSFLTRIYPKDDGVLAVFKGEYDRQYEIVSPTQWIDDTEEGIESKIELVKKEGTSYFEWIFEMK